MFQPLVVDPSREPTTNQLSKYPPGKRLISHQCLMIDGKRNKDYTGCTDRIQLGSNVVLLQDFSGDLRQPC